MKIDRRVYKYIEYEMYHYIEYKKEIANIREEILEGSPEPPDGQPKGSGTSNPTENKALKLITPKGYSEMEKTISSIDTALSLLSERQKEIFKLQYVNQENVNAICRKLYISYETFNRDRRKVVEKVGLELGAIKKF